MASKPPAGRTQPRCWAEPGCSATALLLQHPRASRGLLQKTSTFPVLLLFSTFSNVPGPAFLEARRKACAAHGRRVQGHR